MFWTQPSMLTTTNPFGTLVRSEMPWAVTLPHFTSCSGFWHRTAWSHGPLNPCLRSTKKKPKPLTYIYLYICTHPFTINKGFRKRLAWCSSAWSSPHQLAMVGCLPPLATRTPRRHQLAASHAVSPDPAWRLATCLDFHSQASETSK